MGEVFVFGCSIWHNQATLGGGVYAQKGTLTIGAGTHIFDNAASEHGGGLYFEMFGVANAKLIVAGSEIYSNEAIKDGGGIYAVGDYDIEASGVESNMSLRKGGGVYHSVGTGKMTRTYMAYNHAGTRGGAIYLDSGTLTLNHPWIAANSAGVAIPGIAHKPGTTVTTVMPAVPPQATELTMD